MSAPALAGLGPTEARFLEQAMVGLGPTDVRFLEEATNGPGCGLGSALPTDARFPEEATVGLWPTDKRFLEWATVELGCGLGSVLAGLGPTDARFCGKTAARLTRWRRLARGLALRLVRCRAERRATSIARRDPSTMPASAPFKPSSIAALVYPPSRVNTAGPLRPWTVRSEASRRR